MSYLTFLLQWYNWPYLAGLVLLALSMARLPVLGRLGSRVGGWLGLERASGFAVLRVFVVALAVVGLTVNGALHDYWPVAQERGFVPGLLLTLLITAAVTRSVGRVLEQHFPEIKAVSWRAKHLSGQQGRVVSKMVSRDYRAGRAQVMGDEQTLHRVMCKTRGSEIPFGAMVVLGEYDDEDGRYYVELVDGDRSPEDELDQGEADE
ncbi:MAG: DUF1449 family protein [Gemmatimonadota bacterium]|nr:MAG: DUF1449 family protein [Gemmatimonadota bacterium]